MDLVIIIIVSVVGGLLLLLSLFMLIFFSLKYSGCWGSPEPKSESISEESFSEYSHEHVHTVSGCDGCKNHYPEWVYNELKNQLILAQNVQKEENEIKELPMIPYESNTPYHNGGFEVKDEFEEAPHPHKTVEYEKKVKALRPVKKPAINVPYLKKEQYPKDQGNKKPTFYVPVDVKDKEPEVEIVPTGPAALVEVDNFDPFELARADSDEEKVKEQKLLAMPKDLEVAPLQKPDKSQHLAYENPKIAKRLRKEKLEEEALQQEAELKRKSKKFKIPLETKVEAEQNAAIRANFVLGPQRQIALDTDQKPSSKENVKLDSFLF